MTACSRCGNCCEQISLSVDLAAADPDDERWSDGDRANLVFLKQHWHRANEDTDNPLFSCDQFDPDTRLCMAHDDRPPVCRDYPWYGRPREEWADSAPAKAMHPQCSFNADVRKMLPIVEVR